MVSMTKQNTTSPILPYLNLLAVYLIWGSTYFAVKICISGSAHITSIQLQAIRLSCAGLLLAIYAFATTGQPKNINIKTIFVCFLTGGLLWVLGNGLATFVARYATSSFIVMCMGLIPLWTVLIESIISRQWPDKKQSVALILGLVGLIVMLFPTFEQQHDVEIIQHGKVIFVLCLLMLAGLSWALGTNIQRRQKTTLPTAWIVSFQSIGAAFLLIILALLDGQPLSLSFDLNQVMALGFLVIFGSIVAMIAFQKVIRFFTPTIASTFAYVNPLVGMLLGAVVLHEHIALLSIAGFMIILLSLWIAMKK